MEKTVSHRKTLFHVFFIFSFALPTTSEEERERVYVFVCVDLCVFSRPSDDFKYLLQFHDQLPIRFLHLVSEPVLQGIDGGSRDLKHSNVDNTKCDWSTFSPFPSLLFCGADFYITNICTRIGPPFLKLTDR